MIHCGKCHRARAVRRVHAFAPRASYLMHYHPLTPDGRRNYGFSAYFHGKFSRRQSTESAHRAPFQSPRSQLPRPPRSSSWPATALRSSKPADRQQSHRTLGDSARCPSAPAAGAAAAADACVPRRPSIRFASAFAGRGKNCADWWKYVCQMSLHVVHEPAAERASVALEASYFNPIAGAFVRVTLLSIGSRTAFCWLSQAPPCGWSAWLPGDRIGLQGTESGPLYSLHNSARRIRVRDAISWSTLTTSSPHGVNDGEISAVMLRWSWSSEFSLSNVDVGENRTMFILYSISISAPS